MAAYTHRVTALNGLFLRTGPSPNYPKIGLMPFGTPLRVTSTDASNWHKIDLATNLVATAKVNGTDLLQYNSQSPISYGYCSGAYTEAWPTTPPPIVTTGKTGMGVNVISADINHVVRSLDAGATAASGINMFGQLADLAARRRDVAFMARRYWDPRRGMPLADPDAIFEGAESPFITYLTPLNECDTVCYGTVADIERRASYDGAMWARMKARGRRYAGGGFSVGTPDYTKPEIVDAMRRFYAPLYNDGMSLNYHLYSPTPTHPMDIWYEGRWRFLFERCGFDPSPALAGIYCDETGLDQGGVGGFPKHGMSASQIGAWCRRFLDYSQSDNYGNMLRAAVIFQSGNTTDWAGYNVDYALAEIGAAAQAPVTRQLERPRMSDLTEPPVIAPTPRKVISEYE